MSTDNKVATQPTVSIPVPVTMSPDQFAQLLTAFSNQITTNLGQQIAEGINAARPKRITAGQYDPKSPFHPSKKKTRKLLRPIYQNGARLSPTRLFDAEIDLLNQIKRSGRYINRLVEVIVRQDGSDEVVELRYKNRTIDDRMEHKAAYRSLLDMLQKIVEEQNAALAEEVAVREVRRSFSTAATREARARVAADNAETADLEP